MNIGAFTKDKTGSITGSIHTFGAQFPSVIFEPTGATSGNAPDYTLKANGCELGAAWEKTGKDSGKPYLSVSLKGPFLPATVYAALLENEKKPGNFALVWNEPKPTANA
jgi:uncharacterized protein (DUF736 family)